MSFKCEIESFHVAQVLFSLACLAMCLLGFVFRAV